MVVDLGGALPSGYQSDCTRTHVVGEPAKAPEDFLEAYAVLERAFDAACAAAKPGITAGELDAAGQAILSRLSTGDLSDDAFLADVVARLREHPVLARTREMAMDWAAQAVEGLEGLEEAVLDGTRQRLAQTGIEGEAAAAAMTDAGERVRQVRAAMEDFARILVDRAA